jgi:hypothetical protein
MPKKSAANAPKKETQAPTMPGVTEFQMLRDFVATFEKNLTEAGYTADFDLPNNCLCNSLFQSAGIGIILNDDGEFSLITPFGLVQSFGTLPDSDEVESLYDDLETVLSTFCRVAPINDDELYDFEVGVNVTGYWIISCGDATIHPQPRLLKEDECVNPLKLEIEWSKLDWLSLRH